MNEIPQWSEKDVSRTLPSRNSDSHKGDFGTALLIAGSSGMPGAAVLASLGAMRSGLGKLVVGTAQESISTIASFVPEATFEPGFLESMNETSNDFSMYRAIAIGPGTLPDETMEASVMTLLSADKPLVLDAGALSPRSYHSATAPVILTPHTAEFSRITGIPLKEILGDRPKFASEWAQKLGVTIVLKGQNTIIAFPDGETFINPTGNSSLAKGGTGDTLTGMLLGMLCCHENWKHAVLNGVHLHGACGDEWTRTRSPHTLLAHELSELLPYVMKTFEK